MSDGASAPRTKRNGARIFKNPPQPHMCIMDYIVGSDIPCYVNVLSWEKIDMPASPNQPLPLYGGMKLAPPRTEDKNTRVFAVIAHPEVLRLRGKNAKDPKDQSSLIEVLLDFVESMNKGMKFNRKYKILKDRDITGELKEVWIVVQNQREREAAPNQQETWIDGQPSAPQYPQCTDQQLQLQQQQPPQQPQPPQTQPMQSQIPPQQIHQQVKQQQHHQQQQQQQHHQQQQQQQMQQNQQMMQNSYVMTQPPQYQPNLVYSPVPNNDCTNYDRYSDQQQAPVSYAMTHNKELYDNMMLLRTYNNSYSMRFDSEWMTRGRYLPQQPMPKQQPPPPQQQQPPPQQNCPAYSASQYHFQQMPRQMVPQYMNSNMNPNYNNQMNPVVTSHYQDYMMMQQKHMGASMEQRQMESQMQSQVHPDWHRMQQQQQQQQQEQMAPAPHMQQPPPPQNQPSGMNVMSNAPITSYKRGFYMNKNQHMGGQQKSNSLKRQNNSPTHPKQGSAPMSAVNQSQPKDAAAESHMKPKSPVKVLQRDPSLQNKQNISQPSPEKNSKSFEKSMDENSGTGNVQVTDLDDDTIKPKSVSETTSEVVSKKSEALNYAAALKDSTEYSTESKTQVAETPMSSSSEFHVQELKEVKQHHPNQKQRSIKTVLKRNKSCANDVKVWTKDNKGLKNGMRNSFENMNSNAVERLHDKDGEDYSKGSQAVFEMHTSGWNSHIKQKSSDSPKRTQSTVNSIIKSVFKMHQGNNAAGDDVGTGKKQKANGQARTNTKITTVEHEETNQGYTILKKTEVTTTTSMSTSEEVVNEIAQLSIQDCKDTTEMNAVLS